MLYLVSIHMVPLVPRGPVGKVYRDVTEARKKNFISEMKSSGKGSILYGSVVANACGLIVTLRTLLRSPFFACVMYLDAHAIVRYRVGRVIG